MKSLVELDTEPHKSGVDIYCAELPADQTNPSTPEPRIESIKESKTPEKSPGLPSDDQNPKTQNSENRYSILPTPVDKYYKQGSLPQFEGV